MRMKQSKLLPGILALNLGLFSCVTQPEPLEPLTVCKSASALVTSQRETDFALELQQLSESRFAAEHSPNPELRRRGRALVAARRASLTLNLDDLKEAERELSENQDLSEVALMKAFFHLKLHEPQKAAETLSRLELKSDFEMSAELKAGLFSDLLLAEGHLKRAFDHHEKLKKNGTNSSWSLISREANIQKLRGNLPRFFSLLEEAETLIPTNESRNLAWLYLQRAAAYLEEKAYSKSLKYLLKAENSYSGWWLVEEHMGEVCANLGEKKAAQRIYRQVLKISNSPQYKFALAQTLDDPEEASALRKEAEREYELLVAAYPQAFTTHYVLDRVAEGSLTSDQALKLTKLAEDQLRESQNAELKQALIKLYLATAKNAEAKELAAELNANGYQVSLAL